MCVFRDASDSICFVSFKNLTEYGDNYYKVALWKIKLSRNKSIWLEAHNKKWKGTIDEDWNWVPMRRNFNNTKIFGLHSNWRNGVKFYHRSILISDWFRRSYQWFIWEWKKNIRISLYFFVVWRVKTCLKFYRNKILLEIFFN